jgi:probable F420-dependent oxidoreductase
MTKFGLYIPNVGFESLPDRERIISYVLEAEALGFDSLWVEDRLLHKLPILEPLSLLAFVAAATKKIKLGTSILLLNFRNPIHLARSISTLDHLSGGRMIIGVSLGGKDVEYLAAGVDFKTKAKRFNETLKILKLLLTAEEVNLKTTFFDVRSAMVKPLPRDKIPFLIGGSSENVLRRAGQIGDGWLASSRIDAPTFSACWAKIRNYACVAGRDETALEAAKFTYIHVDRDEESDVSMMQTLLNAYYDFPYDVRKHCIYGSPEKCTQEVQRLLDAGVQTVIFSPVKFESRQVRLISEKVIALLS